MSLVEIFVTFPQYCEQVAGFWLTQPLNVITNLAYIIGGVYLYRYVKVNNLNRNLGIILSGLMIALGVGSTAWHSHKSIPTIMMDEVPIYLFILLSIFILTKSLTKSFLNTLGAMGLVAIIYHVIFTYIPGAGVYSGSLKYAFALFVFVALSMLVVKKYGQEYNFSTPLCIFAIAIALRSVDLYICQYFPLGTHFLWHILVAAAMYTGSKVILRLYLVSSK